MYSLYIRSLTQNAYHQKSFDEDAEWVNLQYLLRTEKDYGEIHTEESGNKNITVAPDLLLKKSFGDTISLERGLGDLP